MLVDLPGCENTNRTLGDPVIGVLREDTQFQQSSFIYYWFTLVDQYFAVCVTLICFAEKPGVRCFLPPL